MSKIVTLEVSRRSTPGGLQLSINLKGEHGYRIAGPKFDGTGTVLLEHVLNARDIDEIRSYLAIAKRALNTSGDREKGKGS